VKLPRVTADQVIRVLEKLDFALARSKGGHLIYRDPRGQRVTVPYHRGQIIRPKTLKSMLRDAKLSVEEFAKLLKGE
jgi:predicted RNA binding protein YcfA (HicA-like mRNA interferase family)